MRKRGKKSEEQEKVKAETTKNRKGYERKAKTRTEKKRNTKKGETKISTDQRTHPRVLKCLHCSY